MKRGLLTDDEFDRVTGGVQEVRISTASADEKFSSPAWLEDIKSEMNTSELVSMNSGNFWQKFKGIFQRMQLE